MADDIFRLKKPCANCPFRNDIEFHLHDRRVDEIADALENDQVFHCHKTVDYSGDRPAVKQTTQFCAGARATLENQGSFPLPFRLGAMLGIYDKPLESPQPVHDSLVQWRKAMHDLNRKK